MRTITAQDIIDTARMMADDAEGAIADDTEALVFVDKAYDHYFHYRIQAEPDAFRTETTFNSGSNTLPADWHSTIGIDYRDGSYGCALTRLQEHERNQYLGASSGPACKYRISRTTIDLFPTPPASQTYTHVYLREVANVTAGTDVLEVRPGHEDFLSLMVARRLLQKEESYDGRYDAEIAKYESELRQEANLRYFNDMVTQAVNDGGWSGWE